MLTIFHDIQTHTVEVDTILPCMKCVSHVLRQASKIHIYRSSGILGRS